MTTHNTATQTATVTEDRIVLEGTAILAALVVAIVALGWGLVWLATHVRITIS